MSPRNINRLSAVLLLLGFGSALVLCLRAEPVVLDPLLGNPLRSKKYLHELRLMGGKANVAFAEFEAWLAGLWQGENLALTVAVLTVAATLAFRFVAAHPALFAPGSSEPPPAPKSARPPSGPPR